MANGLISVAHKASSHVGELSSDVRPRVPCVLVSRSYTSNRGEPRVISTALTGATALLSSERNFLYASPALLDSAPVSVYKGGRRLVGTGSGRIFYGEPKMKIQRIHRRSRRCRPRSRSCSKRRLAIAPPRTGLLQSFPPCPAWGGNPLVSRGGSRNRDSINRLVAIDRI